MLCDKTRENFENRFPTILSFTHMGVNQNLNNSKSAHKDLHIMLANTKF